MLISRSDQLTNEQVVFERQRLIDRCMGKLELAERLVKILSEGLPSDLLDLQSAMDSGDIAKVASLAHRMKGTAANMYAERLSNAAANLERAARSSDLQVVADSWLGLQQEIGVLMEALKR
jgi:HPt (histidine-containing phosphotransfer) domain-containing protein